MDTETVQTWKWTSDAFAEVQWLNRLGAQGWEVERIDKLARFVSKRGVERPRRWEYRRVTGKEAAGRLAAEGWERFGTWLFFKYFKRPAAGAALPAELPSRRVYWSRRFQVLIGFWLVYAATLTFWL